MCRPSDGRYRPTDGSFSPSYGNCRPPDGSFRPSDGEVLTMVELKQDELTCRVAFDLVDLVTFLWPNDRLVKLV